MGFWLRFCIAIISQLAISSLVETFSEFSWRNCGKQRVRDPKIIGGVNSFEGEFPWLVSIKENGLHFCAGLIFNNRMVLTASHCFEDFSYRSLEDPRSIQVTLGEYDLKNSFNSSNAQNVSVKRIIMHPDYKHDNFANDIAILFLKEDIMWTDYISPICLPKKDLLYSRHQIGEMAFVAGWGQTGEQKQTESRAWSLENTLQKVNLTIYENRDCQTMFKNKRISQNVNEGHICAGYEPGGLDSCQGDSGGGLMKIINNRWTAIGIVSAGKGCARQGMPSLYTRVSNYVEWIEKYTSYKKSQFSNTLASRKKMKNTINL